ncbi:interferon alpha-21-like [Candoia aspera]|uniref:interferon alpha-21-like n=1 Tax=Candoia aspera TaxID=51853 RepID=UPI002FD7E70A
MVSGCLQHIVLVLLFSSGIVSLDCNDIVKSQQGAIADIRKLLEAVGTQVISWECFHKIPDFDFPVGKDIGSIKEDTRATIGLMLEQICIIFWHNFTKAEWNMTVVELFQIALDQHIVQWETCSVTETGEKIKFKDIRTKLKLKKYFLRLHRFLKDKEYSPCAWDTVRQEILGISFVFLDQLLRTLQS